MSASWTTTGTGFDDEPRDVHPPSCAVWDTNDPCNCGADEAGVQSWTGTWKNLRLPGRVEPEHRRRL